MPGEHVVPIESNVDIKDVEERLKERLVNLEAEENLVSSALDFDDLARQVHETALEKGFWEGEWDDEKFSTKIALVHSEATEVLEAIRKDQGGEAIAEELADIIIRVLDLYMGLYKMGRTRHSLDNVLQLKAMKNKSRPPKHNNRF